MAVEPGSDSVDATTFSACMGESRCVNVSVTTTGDRSYSAACVKGYDRFFGYNAIGLEHRDLTVQVISTEEDVIEDELIAQQARILDDLISAAQRR